MILTRKASPEAGDLLVAQHTSTYECLVFSETGTPCDYSTLENFRGRYKPRTSTLPATEDELRVDYFTVHMNRTLEAKKSAREALKVSPLPFTIQDVEESFDMDEPAQKNINNTLDNFEELRLEAVLLGWPDDGTFPWVTADNKSVPVTYTQLSNIKKEATVRALKAHMEYNAEREALKALIPEVI